MYPLESAYYSVEIKSTVTAEATRDALQKGRQLNELYYEGKEEVQRANLFPIVSILFAFGSDLSVSGRSELERYADYDPDWATKPVLKAVCVVGRGYWHHVGEEEHWVFHPPTEEYDEVIDLVSAMTNTMITQADRPGRNAPRLGQYLMHHRRVEHIGS
jgi:hypothetical protein